MKNILLMCCSALILVSCSSLESIKKNPNCVVWMDQKYLGPYSTEVIEKKAEWSGSCRGAHWQCRKVEISFDESNNVFKDTVAIGKIENNEFNYSEKESATPLITYTALRVFPELKQVKASIVASGSTTETVYQYTDKCSTEQAIVGGIALGLIAQIQKEK